MVSKILSDKIKLLEEENRLMKGRIEEMKTLLEEKEMEVIR